MQQNIEFERCIDFLVRMIDKYGAEVLRELEEEKTCLINILPLIFGHIGIKTNRHISERKVFTTYSPIFLVPDDWSG